MDENQIKGAATNVAGKVKDAVGGLTGDAKMQVDGKLDQASGSLQSQMGAMKEQITDGVSALASGASELAGQAGSTLRDTAETIRRESGAAGEKAYNAATSAAEYVEGGIKQQPLLTLIGVGVLGYALSYFIHSPSSPFACSARKTSYTWR